MRVGKGVVKVWRHGQDIQGNCHILLGKRIKRLVERWDK